MNPYKAQADRAIAEAQTDEEKARIIYAYASMLADKEVEDLDFMDIFYSWTDDDG